MWPPWYQPEPTRGEPGPRGARSRRSPGALRVPSGPGSPRYLRQSLLQNLQMDPEEPRREVIHLDRAGGTAGPRQPLARGRRESAQRAPCRAPNPTPRGAQRSVGIRQPGGVQNEARAGSSVRDSKKQLGFKALVPAHCRARSHEAQTLAKGNELLAQGDPKKTAGPRRPQGCWRYVRTHKAERRGACPGECTPHPSAPRTAGGDTRRATNASQLMSPVIKLGEAPSVTWPEHAPGTPCPG